MKTKTISAIAAVVCSLLIVSCSEDNPASGPDPNEKGKLILEFDNVVGVRNLQLGGQQSYTNAAGETFNVEVFDYYISNVVLTDAGNKQYAIPQDNSYFLVQESERTSQRITLPDIPAGDYTSITFTIGVDSLRNTMDISRRTGALDPASGMYWAWNSGYIFVKLEGESTSAPDDVGNKYRYHIGGFGGMTTPTINNIKTVTCSFGNSKATVRAAITPTVHVLADILKLFNGTTTMSIAETPTVMFQPYSVNIADNYRHMFSVDHVHNN